MLLASVALLLALLMPVHTPGAVVSTNTMLVCSPGYLVKRPRQGISALRLQAWVQNGHSVGTYVKGHRKYTLDHLVPRELGGSDTLPNLWPQPSAEAKVKDAKENRAKVSVCAGRQSLQHAQKMFETDWRKVP